MYKYIIAILILIAPTIGKGQLQPLSNQYIFNALAINPAYSGSREALSVSLLYRNQWTGVKGAPRTTTFSVHSPLRNEKIGLGLLLISDKIGITRETCMMGSYAYRLKMPGGKLSMGVGFGLRMLDNNWNDLDATDPDDELLNNGNRAFGLPDISMGVFYYSKKFFTGFSVPFFLGHKYDLTQNKFVTYNDFAEYNYLAHVGAIFNLSTQLKLLPSLLIKYTPGQNPQADISSHLIFHDKIWIGSAYRNPGTLLGIFQYLVNNQFKIAYSFDIRFGKINRFGNLSHEVMIRYEFDYTLNVLSPRYF